MIKVIFVVLSVFIGIVIERQIKLPAGTTGGVTGLVIGLGLVIIGNRIYDFFIIRAERYIPSVEVSYSSNGSSFNSNIYAIPLQKNFYLKFGISIRAKGMLWKLFSNVAGCDITYPTTWVLPIKNMSGFYYEYQCTLHDHQRQIHKEGSPKSCKPAKYIITAKDAETGTVQKYTVAIYETSNKVSFKIAASNRPKKAECIFKITQKCREVKGGDANGTNNPNREFSVEFKKKVDRLYSTTIVPGFVDCFENIC
jgi:hypothetical protein